MMRKLFAFPDPVNEVAARTVAAGVLVMAVLALALRQPWLLVPLAYGFWARVLTGPTLSPLGQLATRVVAPALPVRPRLTPGPPKRFAQGIGTVVTTAAVVVWATAGWGDAAWLVVLLLPAAFLEAAFGYCVGCRLFAVGMRMGLVPERVCEACADITRRPRAATP
ncbi:MAG TPA: DUF4395 domain-containing protein [Acidimicrobiales bacterium]|nr:DUF4395 domain-containing protein [Acidimicrobiales bacterium]